jgi:hypothetical protein
MLPDTPRNDKERIIVESVVRRLSRRQRYADHNGVLFRVLTYSYYAFPMMVVWIAICHIYVWWRNFSV